MIKILFKNVGQGDSILIEWIRDNRYHYGILDSNLYENENPILEEIKSRNITHLDFIIISHLHYDHYSGIAEILDFCITKKITIGFFLHTFTNEFAKILDTLFLSQKEQNNTTRLLDNIIKANNDDIIIEMAEVSNNFKPISLFDDVKLNFLSPSNKDSLKLASQRVHYDSKRSTTPPNFNIMSTIIMLTNESVSVLLTSDATKKKFKELRNTSIKNIHLVQVPHHGSKYNLEETFWKKIDKKENCPAVFSVGRSMKDKLPDKEVISFFEGERFYNTSTNPVYGLSEFYNLPETDAVTNRRAASLYLSSFSNLSSKSQAPNALNSRFSGDKLFTISFEKEIIKKI